MIEERWLISLRQVVVAAIALFLGRRRRLVVAQQIKVASRELEK